MKINSIVFFSMKEVKTIAPLMVLLVTIVHNNSNKRSITILCLMAFWSFQDMLSNIEQTHMMASKGTKTFYHSPKSRNGQNSKKTPSALIISTTPPFILRERCKGHSCSITITDIYIYTPPSPENLFILAGPRKPSQSPWANECWCGGPCNPHLQISFRTVIWAKYLLLSFDRPIF